MQKTKFHSYKTKAQFKFLYALTFTFLGGRREDNFFFFFYFLVVTILQI
jgi:hypothetical protein